jgi:hypothetical protein
MNMLDNLHSLTRILWKSLDPDSGGAEAAIITMCTE